MANENLNSDQNLSAKPFESDAKKIVRRHLADENHVITDEDLKSIRIGVTPVAEEGMTTDVESVVEEVEKESNDNADDVPPSDDPITPWDTVQR